jgi:hypothetical protein
LDTQVLDAAMTIRAELATLVPAEADTLGEQLDQLIAHAGAAQGEERSATLDAIVEVLISREPTRLRLAELISIHDVPRGAGEEVWAGDGLLAGELADDGDVVVVACRACGFENQLAFRPTADDPPECQNPEPPQHPLKMD